MTKEEKIKEAWGLAYDEVKHLLTDNGYIWSVDLAHIRLNLSSYNLDLNYNDIGARPKSLQGIEHNNNWIKIESEDDLPKEKLDVHFIFTEFKGEEGRFQTFGVWDNKLKSFYSGALKIKTVTHYQPIEKPKPPLY